MSSSELLEKGRINEWYEVNTEHGYYNISFIRASTKITGTIFSIAAVNEREDRVKVIDQMLIYANTHQNEDIIFENNKWKMKVLIDVLETC